MLRGGFKRGLGSERSSVIRFWAFIQALCIIARPLWVLVIWEFEALLGLQALRIVVSGFAASGVPGFRCESAALWSERTLHGDPSKSVGVGIWETGCSV